MFLRSNQPVGTYYAAANPELLKPRAQLTDALECEVLVIGAGDGGVARETEERRHGSLATPPRGQPGRPSRPRRPP